jgi:D-3-phosphoglycerate dehydrogenase / 2-oxoglutarate reductase
VARWKALITDYAWPDLEIESKILSQHEIELIVAPKGASESDLIALATSADAILTNWAKTTSAIIKASGKVQIVSRLGIGLDNIDVAFCTQHGIPVTNIPDYCLIEVAEHALAQLFSLARKIAFYHHETQQGRYQLQSGTRLRRIEGQTLGIIGMGNIGRRVAQKAHALGLRVIASPNKQRPNIDGVKWVDFETLLRSSDYISLHAPATAANRHLFSTQQFEQMKSTAFLINTARGSLVDHAALAYALANNQLAGAALDVQDPEPPDLSVPPYNDPRVLVSPHAAFVSEESLANLRTRAAQQVADRLSGRTPENIVNLPLSAK